MRIFHALLVVGILAFSISVANALSVGDSAPLFSLENQNGETVSLSDYKDGIVVLEWLNPDCPYVQRHYRETTMKTLSEKYNEKVTWLAINSTHYMDSTVNENWKNTHMVNYPILNDNGGEVGKSYGAKTTPHMFIINKGVVVYAGAIDDDPHGENSADKRNQYVNIGLGEITAGNAITTSETKPYGCSVKYK